MELPNTDPGAPAAVEGGRTVRPGQRLHPLSPVFEIGSSFMSIVVPGLVMLFLAAGDSYERWYMLAFVPAVLLSLKRYLTLRYELTAEHLVVRDGVFFKKTRHIPYARVQNIDTVQNPLHRFFGVAEVRLETASGQEPEAVLRVLSLARLEQIRAGVFSGRRRATQALHRDEATLDDAGQELADTQADVAGRPFLRLNPSDVVYFGLLSQRGLAYLSGLFYLIWEFDLGDRLKKLLEVDPERAISEMSPWLGALLALGVILVLQALTVFWAFVTLHDFKLLRQEDDLLTSCGLWTRQTATLPRRRIQFLQVREGWLQRRLGRLSLRTLTAGADAGDSTPVSRKWLVPLVRKEALPAILREVQPDLSLDEPAWKRVDPRARGRLIKRGVLLAILPCIALPFQIGWWTALVASVFLCAWVTYAHLRVRRLGYALTDTGILVRDGALTHVRNAVLFSRIQSVSLTQSPFDRRRGMASVRVDTAGRADVSLAFTVPFLGLGTARRLERHLRRRAAATPFPW